MAKEVSLSWMRGGTYGSAVDTLSWFLGIVEDDTFVFV